MAGLVLAFMRPHKGEDVCVGSGIQSLSLVGCSHWFGVHDPCGTHSIWYCLFLLGPTIVQGCFWWFLISRLGVVSLVLFMGLVHLLFFFVFSGSKSCEVLRACLVGVLHYFFDFLFPCLALHISMGPGRSFVLRIGSNSIEVSGLGRMNDESDSLAVVVHRVAPGEPPFPLGKGKGKISEIRYPSGTEYLRVAIQNA